MLSNRAGSMIGGRCRRFLPGFSFIRAAMLQRDLARMD